MSQIEEEEVPSTPSEEKEGAPDSDQESSGDNDTANQELPESNDISLVDSISSRIRFVILQIYGILGNV